MQELIKAVREWIAATDARRALNASDEPALFAPLKKANKRVKVAEAALRREALAAQVKPSCVWKQDEDGNWDTACGDKHIYIDGTPKENGAKFCCYCGAKLKEVPFNGE